MPGSFVSKKNNYAERLLRGQAPLLPLDQLFTLCRRLPQEQSLYCVDTIPSDTELENNPEGEAEYQPMIEEPPAGIATPTDLMEPSIGWYPYILISTLDTEPR